MLRRFTERRQVHPWTAPPGTCGRPCPSARSSWRAPCRGRPHPAKMHQRRGGCHAQGSLCPHLCSRHATQVIARQRCQQWLFKNRERIRRGCGGEGRSLEHYTPIHAVPHRDCRGPPCPHDSHTVLPICVLPRAGTHGKLALAAQAARARSCFFGLSAAHQGAAATAAFVR